MMMMMMMIMMMMMMMMSLTMCCCRGGSCSMADGCFYNEDADSIQKIFTQNFLEHYTKSKAPFPLFFHAAWFFNRAHRKEGFLKFIDSILALPDVYFVTSQELIAWTRYPEPLPAVTIFLFSIKIIPIIPILHLSPQTTFSFAGSLVANLPLQLPQQAGSLWPEEELLPAEAQGCRVCQLLGLRF